MWGARDENLALYCTGNTYVAVGTTEIDVIKSVQRQFIISEYLQMWLTSVGGVQEEFRIKDVHPLLGTTLKIPVWVCENVKGNVLIMVD